jgi:hypothetical protein
MSTLKRQVTISPDIKVNEAGWESFKVVFEEFRGAEKRTLCPFCHTSLSHRMDCQHSTAHKGWKKWTFIGASRDVMLLIIQRDYPEGLRTEVYVTNFHFRAVMEKYPQPLSIREAVDWVVLKDGAVREFSFDYNGEQRKGWMFVIHPRNEKHAIKIKQIIEANNSKKQTSKKKKSTNA